MSGHGRRRRWRKTHTNGGANHPRLLQRFSTFTRFHKTSIAEAWTFPVVQLWFRMEWATSCDIFDCTSEISSNDIETARFNAHTCFIFYFSILQYIFVYSYDFTTITPLRQRSKLVYDIEMVPLYIFNWKKYG